MRLGTSLKSLSLIVLFASFTAVLTALVVETPLVYVFIGIGASLILYITGEFATILEDIRSELWIANNKRGDNNE